jgi:hypothetical protein
MGKLASRRQYANACFGQWAASLRDTACQDNGQRAHAGLDFQIRKKAWATNKIMGDLLTALKDIFRPQTLLCSGGHDKKLDARTYLTNSLSKK